METKTITAGGVDQDPRTKDAIEQAAQRSANNIKLEEARVRSEIDKAAALVRNEIVRGEAREKNESDKAAALVRTETQRHQCNNRLKTILTVWALFFLVPCALLECFLWKYGFEMLSRRIWTLSCTFLIVSGGLSVVALAYQSRND